MNKDQILEAYRFRHACKEFDAGRMISEEDFRFILETGRLSPSSFGFEPWKFVILQNKELREKLLPVTWGAQKTLPTASHFVLMLTRTRQGLAPDSEHIQSIMRNVQELPEEVAERKASMYRIFLESDFNLWNDERLVFEWASRQTYIALGNMMTAAAQIGIDSCPIEGFVKEQAEQVLEDAGILDRSDFGLSCMVAFGYRIREPRDKTRRPLDQVAEWVL
jgi:nitroreductase